MPNKWVCKICKHSNESIVDICIMCDTERPNIPFDLEEDEEPLKGYLHMVILRNALKLKEKEENVIYKFKESITKLQGVKRDSLENELQKQLNNIFSSKMDLVSKGILLASGYQRNLLILEEISFDNSIMIDNQYEILDDIINLIINMLLIVLE